MTVLALLVVGWFVIVMWSLCIMRSGGRPTPPPEKDWRWPPRRGGHDAVRTAGEDR